MKDLQRRQLRTLHKVLDCLEFYAIDEPRAAGPRKRIADAIVRIEALDVQQRAAASLLDLDHIDLAPLRLTLREDHLLPLARQGNEILDHQGGTRGALKVPTKRASNEAHIAAGDRFADCIAPHNDAFMGENNPADFLDRLRAATDALRVRAGQSGAAIRERAAATAELTRLIPAARRQIDVLDGVLRPRLRVDAAFRHSWERAKRIDAPMGRPKQRGKKKKK